MDTDNFPPTWILSAVAAANLLALADLPYGYYQFLRLVVCGVGIWTALACQARGWSAATIIVGLIAILYNPLFKIHLERDVHAVVNVCVALIFAVIAILLRRPAASQ